MLKSPSINYLWDLYETYRYKELKVKQLNKVHQKKKKILSKKVRVDLLLPDKIGFKAKELLDIKAS